MHAKRIIPCLDIKNGRVVKGTNFINLRDAGSAVELAERYYNEGADELVFLDITASEEKRKTLLQIVKDVASVIRIPFTVGGGISSVDDISALLNAGADKISLNTAAVKNPELITESAKKFGSQAVVAAIDVEVFNGVYSVFIKGGKVKTSLEGLTWGKRVNELGAGEILLTSMHKDGTKEGFDLNFLSKLSNIVSIPVVASGGAGKPEHFYDAFILGADACLAASLFHYNKLKIKDLKDYLQQKGIPVRL